MSQYRVWGRISSINVRKVMLAAQWMRLDVERIDAGLSFGVVQTPDYLAKNPNALVPVLEEPDGFTLYESNVIVRYLAAKHSAGDLYPTDLRTRFDAERWMDWQQTTLNGAGREAFVQLVRTPAHERNMDNVAQSVKLTEPLLDRLDAHLGQQPYMAGDRFTIADIPIACEMHRWLGTPVEHRARPNLDRWYEGIRNAPAAHGVLDIPLS